MNSSNELKLLYQESHKKSSDKWSLYLDVYDRWLKEYREKEIELLEIGVQNGGSLEIWSKYFTNYKKIVGSDIDQGCEMLAYDTKNIEIVIGDVNEKFDTISANFTDGIDIIIDDGSHKSGDIVQAFSNYFPLVKEDGLYIIEDLHCSYWGEFEGGLDYPISSISFLKKLADIVNFQHWGDDSLNADDVFLEFKENYSLDIDEQELEKIHSVSFYNSICIIEKKEKEKNIISARMFTDGSQAVVNHRGVDAGFNALDQSENKWTEKGYSLAYRYDSLNEDFEKLKQEKMDVLKNGEREASLLKAEIKRFEGSLLGKVYKFFRN